MDFANPDALVSTRWLASHLESPDGGVPEISVVDASFWLPVSQRHAHEEYLEGHIPGAVFLDIDDVADQHTDLPHMLPAPEVFADKVGRLGLGDDRHIVVYDNAGGAAAAARVWWMFRLFGHRRVAVLNGGFPRWLRERRPVSDVVPTPEFRIFTPRPDYGLRRTLDEVCADMESHPRQILDARSPGRFAGHEPEPRAVPRHGHIPGSINVPFLDLLDRREMTFLSAETIAARFAEAGCALDQKLVVTCGSGVTSCLLALGLYLIGKTDVANYDGSWAEWTHHTELPIETA
ncbi:MAG: sulfurtransferase [Alphaproteobacteria bacterium]